LYKDYLVLCSQKNPQGTSQPNEICIYNLKTKKVESIDRSSRAFPLLNHSACFCRAEDAIVFFGKVVFGNLISEKHKSVIMSFDEQDNGFFSVSEKH